MSDAFSNLNDNHDHKHDPNRFAVIPTAAKLSADARFSGRGVRIAFLDSGFFPHPDFASRVVAFHDVAGEENSFDEIVSPQGHHWHGTQTVAVCGGSGALSDGVYRGLATDAELVLVKVSKAGRISDDSIEEGLLWVLANHERFAIRVVNMSLGGDCDAGADESRINRLAEILIGKGICITVAAGNSSEQRSIPPASAPSVITVGGYSDENRLSEAEYELYHSNFGATIDGLIKPELIAPAMYIAAPILPETDDYRMAETLSMLAAAPDYALPQLLERNWSAAGLPRYPAYENTEQVRRAIEERLRDSNIVATHYKHVDGTSFAAPITASVIAQMLEANPDLTPLGIKNILISTARKLSREHTIRQGFGVVNPSLAVARAVGEAHFLNPESYHSPQIGEASIRFTFHDDAAKSVALVGDFTDWKTNQIEFSTCADGIWRVSIARPNAGTYRYKYLIDGLRWTEDASHGLKVEDGFGGFNSLLEIP